MTKDKFFQKYGDLLVKSSEDNYDGGDFLFFHPEDIDLLMDKYQNDDYQIVSVHDDCEEETVDMTQPCDFGEQPFKYGYFVIERP